MAAVFFQVKQLQSASLKEMREMALATVSPLNDTVMTMSRPFFFVRFIYTRKLSLGRNTQKTSGGAANCRLRPEHFPFPLLSLPTLGDCVQQVAAVDLVHFILTAIHHHHHPFNARNNSSGSKNEPTERHSCQGPVSFFRTILHSFDSILF